MVTRTVVRTLDDLDGTEGASTIKFGLDGMNYEIDLNEKNAKKMRDALAKYTTAGRSTGRGFVARRGTPGRATNNAGSVEQNKAIRAWAKREGKDVSDRGRIPQQIVDEFHAKAGRASGGNGAANATKRAVPAATFRA